MSQSVDVLFFISLRVCIYVVDVLSVDLFKLRLDKFWAVQYIMFDWTADLTGTGNSRVYYTDIEARCACIRSSTLLIAEHRINANLQ